MDGVVTVVRGVEDISWEELVLQGVLERTTHSSVPISVTTRQKYVDSRVGDQKRSLWMSDVDGTMAKAD